MTDLISCIQSLHVDDVKVYHVRGNEATVLTKGRLEVIYVPDFDRFVLRVNSVKYALSKQLPIRGSNVEARAFRSYILPTIEGYYLVKLKSQPNPAVILNLETIFNNYSTFSYQSEQEAVLRQQMIGESNYVAQRSNGVPVDNYTKAGVYLKKGGEFLKQNLIKGAYYVSKSADKDAKVQTSNQLYVKTIDELRGSNNIDNPACQLHIAEINGMLDASNTIQQGQHNRQMERERNAPMNNQLGKGDWNTLKKTAGESASSLWQGMDETVSILAKALKFKKSKKQAGAANTQVFKQGPEAHIPAGRKAEVVDVKTKITEEKYVNPFNQPVVQQNPNPDQYVERVIVQEDVYVNPAGSFNQPNYYENQNVDRNTYANNYGQNANYQPLVNEDEVAEGKYPKISGPYTVSQFINRHNPSKLELVNKIRGGQGNDVGNA